MNEMPKCPCCMIHCVVKAQPGAHKFAEKPTKAPELSAHELAAVLRGDFCNRLCSGCPLQEIGNSGVMDCMDVAKNQAARMLDEMATEKAGWISVKDRLPDEYDVVLVCVNNGKYQTVRTAYISSYGEWRWIDASLKVTYWMHLPEIPEEGKNE